ncbi:MAG: hypothetical protein ACREUQ_07365 [Burkholderiales bacterium]
MPKNWMMYAAVALVLYVAWTKGKDTSSAAPAMQTGAATASDLSATAT